MKSNWVGMRQMEDTAGMKIREQTFDRPDPAGRKNQGKGCRIPSSAALVESGFVILTASRLWVGHCTVRWLFCFVPWPFSIYSLSSVLLLPNGCHRLGCHFTVAFIYLRSVVCFVTIVRVTQWAAEPAAPPNDSVGYCVIFIRFTSDLVPGCRISGLCSCPTTVRFVLHMVSAFKMTYNI